uniref:uncharacterized protein LOC131125109 isoform X2 n=1 Tax=Doryrhamphus excisus TaxID=161450 RepID=UPI0025AE1390|nr:uncharacterized protein LOC131125109 isoform X2 [Doryrhamphus excisus]
MRPGCLNSQEKMYSPPLSTCRLLSTGAAEPPTDIQIQTLIAEKLAYFRNCNDGIHGSATIQKECRPIRTEVASTNAHHREDRPMVEMTKHPVSMVKDSFLLNENKPVSSKPECQVASTKPVKVTNTQMIKDPQYDDISDDDDGEISKVCCEKPQYEDISDDESPTSEIPLPPKTIMSILNSAPQRHDTTKVHMITSGEIEDERQINQSVLPSKHQHQDQEGNTFCVIPLHLLSLKYEPPKDFVVLDKGATKETRPSKLLASPSASRLEVYDSSEIYQQVNAMEFADHFEVLEDDIDEKKDAFQKKGLLYVDLDSCETEDSCDYSSSSECNYLTVSKHLLERSASLCSAEDNSHIGQHFPHKRRPMKANEMQSCADPKNVTHKAKKLTHDLVPNTVHILDSSEDENDVQLIETTDSRYVQINTRRSMTQNLDCDEKEHGHVTNGEKRFRSGSLDITDAFFVPHKKHPY